MGWLRCPYPIALVVFFATMAICLFIGGREPSNATLSLPPASSAVATLTFALIVEALRHRSWPCSWSQSGLLARVAGYGALFLIGILLAWPAMTPARWVGSIFRWELPIVFLVLLFITIRHVRHEHRP